MDFYQFINSRDIREYLQKINYQFSSLEKAFIVYQSYKPLQTKIAAYKYIINECEDVEIKERSQINAHPSLKEYLKDYILFIKRVLDEFAKKDDAIFTYSYFTSFIKDWMESNFYSQDLDTIKEQVKEEYKFSMIYSYKIRKCYLDDKDRYIEVEYDGNHNIIHFDCPMDEEEGELCYGLVGLFFDIPTPFKKGDILVRLGNPWAPNEDIKPVVMTDISSWSIEKLKQDAYLNADFNEETWGAEYKRFLESGDLSDMYVSGFCMDEKGTIGRSFIPSYLDYEYYREDITDDLRPLKAISLYIKGEIYIEELIEAISIYKLEQERKERIASLDVIDAILNKLNIEKPKKDED